MPIDLDSKRALQGSPVASLGILASGLNIGSYTDIEWRKVCMWDQVNSYRWFTHSSRFPESAL
jgi:hypothetical protein